MQTSKHVLSYIPPWCETVHMRKMQNGHGETRKCTEIDAFFSFAPSFFPLSTLHPVSFSIPPGFNKHRVLTLFFHTLQIIIISHGFVWMKDGVIVQWATCFPRNWWKSAAHWTTWSCVWGLKFQLQPSSTPILSAILYQNLSRRESTPEKPLSKLTEPRGELVLKWSKWQWPMPRTRLQVWYG
jgi:hypothetical protein